MVWHRKLSHLNFDTINLLSKKDIVIGLPKLKYVKDQLCSSCVLGKTKRSTFKTKIVPSLKGRLNLLHMDLCGPIPLFEEYFTAGNQSVSKSSSLSDNSIQQDTQPIANIQSTTEPITQTTNVNAEENNNDQAAHAQIDKNKFYNIFDTPVRKEAESSTRNVDNSVMQTFYQRHQSEHRWTKDHPLEQVRGNPSKPVQTR
ncbi:retrovirus-related pol polyprotein from transposon TNT 1-94 [Tanacetum coccineum]